MNKDNNKADIKQILRNLTYKIHKQTPNITWDELDELHKEATQLIEKEIMKARINENERWLRKVPVKKQRIIRRNYYLSKKVALEKQLGEDK